MLNTNFFGDRHAGRPYKIETHNEMIARGMIQYDYYGRVVAGPNMPYF